MKTLKYVPRPYPQESPTSVLIRTAKQNGFGNVMHMCRTVAVGSMLRILEMYLRTGSLCDLLCNEAPELAPDLHACFYQQQNRHLSRVSPVMIQGEEVSSRSISYEFRPCSRCIAEGYTRFSQDIKAFDVCPFHHVPLMTNCRQCGRANHWYQINGFTCRCGHNFGLDDISQSSDRVYPTSAFGPLGLAANLNTAEKAGKIRAQFSDYLPSPLEPLMCSPADMKQVIMNDIRRYRCLPVSAFEAPWLNLTNADLRFQALNLVKSNYRHIGRAQCKDCCSEVWMRLAEVSDASGISRGEVLRLARRKVFTCHGTQQKDPYYSARQMCDLIRGETPNQTDLHRSNSFRGRFYSPIRVAEELTITVTAVRALIKAGVFCGVIKIDEKLYIPIKSIADFHKQFVLGSEIAAKLGVSPKTISSSFSHLGIPIALSSTNDWTPKFYLRNEVKILSHAQLLSAGKNYICSSCDRRPWLVATSAELKMKPVALRDLVINHFKFKLSLTDFTETQFRCILEWRSAHCTIPEACAEFKITRSMFISRFIRTNYIECVKLGRFTFVRCADMSKISHHLKTYYSVKETATRLSIGVNKARLLASSGLLETGDPLMMEAGKQVMILKNQMTKLIKLS